MYFFFIIIPFDSVSSFKSVISGPMKNYWLNSLITHAFGSTIEFDLCYLGGVVDVQLYWEMLRVAVSSKYSTSLVIVDLPELALPTKHWVHLFALPETNQEFDMQESIKVKWESTLKKSSKVPEYSMLEQPGNYCLNAFFRLVCTDL